MLEFEEYDRAVLEELSVSPAPKTASCARSSSNRASIAAATSGRRPWYWLTVLVRVVDEVPSEVGVVLDWVVVEVEA